MDNLIYKYQFSKKQGGGIVASREAADPSMIMFNDRYYIFPSMTCGFLYSDDLVEWKFQQLKSIPVYDYAPDVRVVGEYIYFCASNHEQGRFFRTMDPFKDDFEEIKSEFLFWDPNLFVDDDGRMYLYWGSSTSEPLYGIELNPDDMTPIGEKKGLVYCNDKENGYERSGENHIPRHTPEKISEMLKSLDDPNNGMSEEMKEVARSYIMCAPYIEGVWMTKHNGKYYLQYSSPSSQNNIYNDGVYIGERPLGPFKLAQNNPFSYKPGGFIPGAGHGSTMEDVNGKLWHIATMRISINHNFERRIGIWPSGWDDDGDMFCNQRFGDWPMSVEKAKNNPWVKPEWMLLSYGKVLTFATKNGLTNT